eukprot:9494216-Pyramimonas_sp.AAC.1
MANYFAECPLPGRWQCVNSLGQALLRPSNNHNRSKSLQASASERRPVVDGAQPAGPRALAVARDQDELAPVCKLQRIAPNAAWCSTEPKNSSTQACEHSPWPRRDPDHVVYVLEQVLCEPHTL